MKKRAEISKLLTAVFFTVVALTAGCGESSRSAVSAAVTNETAMEDAASYDEGTYETGDSYAEGATDTSGIETPVDTGRKLIKTVSLSMETRDFDGLTEEIQSRVEELGGYTESSDIAGSSYYGDGYRTAWLQLRIPTEKLEDFVTAVSSMGNVTDRNESVEDITLQYVDTESHKKALETEQERLLELMKQADSVEDLIAIETRLSEIRYQLQSYESTLRTYDNQVDYSTVNVDIREVERESAGAGKQSYLEEVKNRLSDNFYAIGRGFRSFSIWFIASLPYLVLLAAVIFLAGKLLRKLPWHKPFLGRKQEKEKEKQ